MGNKKKKKSKQKKDAREQLENAESREELLVLQAIFAEAMEIRPDESGFSIRVVPHPGEAAANHVAVQLIVSYPRGYPSESLVLKLAEAQGLADSDVKALSKQLHQTAEAYAAEGEVCCFQLVNLCQEFLQARNVPAEEGEEPPPQPESLWHEMQLREAGMGTAEADAADVDFSMRASGFLGGDTWGFDGIGGSLFAETTEPAWSAPAVPGSPPTQVAAPLPRVSKAAKRQLAGAGETTTGLTFSMVAPPKLPLEPTVKSPFEATAAAAGAAATATATAGAAQPASEQTGGDAAGAAAAAATVQTAATTRLPPWVPSGGVAAAVAAAAAKSAVAPAHRRSVSGTSQGGEEGRGALDGGATSMSRMNSMLTAVKHSIRAVLPRMLRKHLDDGSGAEAASEASEAGESSVGLPENDTEREQIRRELLLGHLLTLAASGANAAVPPHALPAVASMLQAQGLLPKWVGWTLTQQPALFDRAFQRLFAQEMKRRAGTDEEHPSAEDWAIHRFWQRRPLALAQARGLASLRPQAHGRADDAGIPASRYENDFAEIRQLGRGGYGVVMLAVNRMDGRQYAIKKIVLDAHSPTAYARIMREVTTLSRLQHPNVVRYFQAWVEITHTAPGASRPGSGSDESEWGSGSGTFSSSPPGSPTAPRRASGAHKAKGGVGLLAGGTGAAAAAAAAGRKAAAPLTPALYPLSENSKEGRTSSPSQLGGYDTSMGGEPSAASSGGLGFSNLAVSDGSRLLSASVHGSHSRLTVMSGESSEVPWQSAHGGSSLTSSGSDSGADGGESGESGDESDESSTAGASSSSSEDEGDTTEEEGTETETETEATASATVSASASATTNNNSAFTFERSRPSGTGSGVNGDAAVGGRGGGAGGRSGFSSSQVSRRTKGGSPRLRQMLYIQMEFCPRTLRDVLDSGPLEEADRWRVLRQILAGLAHIHSQGIIHRDLKPANIFYDAKGDIKLGDFGLAKFNAQGTDGDLPSAPAAPAALAGGLGGKPGMSGTRGGTLPSESTGVCGTSYYISPEIANSWASYDERVDLYSLGVVTFELWHPFSTGMERVVLLRDLRENDVMPADFEAANPLVCKLIRWLMAPNPTQRPTAKEVLRSDLLPATVGDEQLRDLLRSLPDNPATYDRVVDAVFNMSRGSEAAEDEVAGAPAPVQMAARDHIVEVVKEVFGRHGAVPMCSLDVGFASADDPKGAMQVLSPSGVKLALRYEMRQPFANWVVHQVAKGGQGSLLLDGFRRYELSWVQRRVAGQAGLPRAYLQADLDFILPAARTPAEGLLGEAEVMSAVHDVLLELPECGHLEIRIGHRQLFEVALQYVGVSRELRGSVAQLLSTASATSPLHATARSKRWPSIRAGLEGLGLGAEAIGRCRQLVLQSAGEAETALFRLRAYLSQVATKAAAGAGGQRLRHGAPHPLACLDELQALLPHLEAWGLPSAQLVVDPLVPPHAEYFSGPLFQFHSLQEASGATSVVAVGGRYDGLLKAAWARQAGLLGIGGAMPGSGAVGATLNVERLVALAAASARWRSAPARGPAGLAKLSQADVLVCSRGGGGLLRERMQLVRALWDAGVSAEMLHAAAPSLTEQYEYANSRSIPCLVIIQGATFSAADTVQVKFLQRRLEEEVPVADVARYLQAALAPQHGGGGGGGGGAGLGGKGLASLRSGVGAGGGEGEDVHGEGGEHEVSVHGGRERERERRRGRDKR